MAVYVDDSQLPFGRMRMCHMVADTTEELLAMADRIGVARRWLQKAGSHHEHFDICLSKRRLAIKHGAHPISAHELRHILLRKRAGHECKISGPQIDSTLASTTPAF